VVKYCFVEETQKACEEKAILKLALKEKKCCVQGTNEHKN